MLSFFVDDSNLEMFLITSYFFVFNFGTEE